jgi:fatty-acyl-CoA synthase
LCVALRPRFSASGFLADVKRYDATYFNYVGRSLAYVLATPATPQDADNKLRMGFGTEASLRDREQFSQRFNCELIERYGSSEGVISTYRPPGTPESSIGLPQPRPGSDVTVVDQDTRRECPAAQFDAGGALLNADKTIGEIVDRGGAPGFEGYYNNDEANHARRHDGWYWSGDLAFRDADGHLFFAGRNTDWLRVDSENFASAPVETVISRHPDVVMAAVYAVPDPRTGDQVMTALELRSGTTFDPAEFAAFLASQPDLGSKWAPTFVRIVDAMPLTATNKVDKAPLRRAGWSTERVYWRPGSDLAYEPFTDEAAADLRAEFETHGRTHLLG